MLPGQFQQRLLLSLLVVLACRAALSESDFAAWGWRLPFLFSFVLLVFSVWLRARLEESPVLLRMKARREVATAPVRESLGQWSNLRLVIFAGLWYPVAVAAMSFVVCLVWLPETLGRPIE